MSTKMSEEDWAHTLAVFRACLPRRGRKAGDDRRFLEALHFFTVENVRWRALPERFGPCNSVWKRFDRLSKAGVFEAFFDSARRRMSSSAHLIQMFELDDRARAWVCGRSKGGQEGQALGRSRRGFTAKIDSKSDASGSIIAFDLTGGEASDARLDVLLDIGPDIQPRAPIRDRKGPTEANREAARDRGIVPVIPHKANERDKPAFFAKTLDKARASGVSNRASDASSASNASLSDPKRQLGISDQS